MTTRTPKCPTTARARARRWCLDNPGEVLTKQDLREKFGVTARNADAIVLHLRREGLLMSEPLYMARRPDPREAA